MTIRRILAAVAIAIAALPAVPAAAQTTTYYARTTLQGIALTRTSSTARTCGSFNNGRWPAGGIDAAVYAGTAPNTAAATTMCNAVPNVTSCTIYVNALGIKVYYTTTPTSMQPAPQYAYAMALCS